MNMDWNARCSIFPASDGGSRLRGLAWRRSRTSDGRDCNWDGCIRPPSPSRYSAGLCVARHRPSGYRWVRRRIDDGARVDRIPFLADGRCSTPYHANDGARQSRLGSGDASGRLHDHASRVVLARTAAVDHCHMVSSASISREWQRPILANFAAADVRDGVEGIAEFRRGIDECPSLWILPRSGERKCHNAIDANGIIHGVTRHSSVQAILH